MPCSPHFSSSMTPGRQLALARSAASSSRARWDDRGAKLARPRRVGWLLVHAGVVERERARPRRTGCADHHVQALAVLLFQVVARVTADDLSLPNLSAGRGSNDWIRPHRPLRPPTATTPRMWPDRGQWGLMSPRPVTTTRLQCEDMALPKEGMKDEDDSSSSFIFGSHHHSPTRFPAQIPTCPPHARCRQEHLLKEYAVIEDALSWNRLRLAACLHDQVDRRPS